MRAACGPHSLASALIISVSPLSLVSAISSSSWQWIAGGWDLGSGRAQVHPPPFLGTFGPLSLLAGTEVVWEGWSVCHPVRVPPSALLSPL